jgi:predicted RNA-binding protein with PIN domain
MTADAYIIELVDQSRTPKTLTVVTSDTGLANQCRSLRAHATTIEAFINLIVEKTSIKEEEKPTQKLSDTELERLQKIFEKRLDS